jgi:NADPH-dependent 2,4-dienoyl-CoA reductase/sulfur reductase-like enzyme/nitrite reductase/ring-hydroxylating ferredoxin subunit
MDQSNAAPAGPDFAAGIARTDIPDEGTLAGHVAGEPVLLSRLDGRLHAIGAVCSHYGGPLGEGLAADGVVRCPWHHACFDLRTGAALHAPAFTPVDRWRVEEAEGRVFVREKLAEAAPVPKPARPADPAAIVIVGGGAAGFACAAELRALGYDGALTMLSADADPPCDRPNLSKDYLAGTAPEEWIPLRDAAFYRDQKIDLRLAQPVSALDVEGRAVIAGGERFAFDRLLLATGADPVRLPVPGFTADNVHLLRSLADARALIARARSGARAAVIGSSFIGLEAAAALRKRGVEVVVVSESVVPFAHVFGRDVGLVLQRLHEANGVRFQLGRTLAAFDGKALTLSDASRIEADFVVAGVGVRPRTALAARGIAVADGIVVDRMLATGVPGIYAAGDVAAYPDPIDGRPVRIEHWVVAERQGQVAARNMLGLATPYAAVPFFWTEQYGVSLRYVGHARHWDEIRIDGDIAAHDFIARFFRGGTLRASLACGRDRESLEDELALERMAGGA